MRAAEGVSGWIGLIAVISCMRIWYLCEMSNSFTYYTETPTHAYHQLGFEYALLAHSHSGSFALHGQNNLVDYLQANSIRRF